MGEQTRFRQFSTRFLMTNLSGGRRWKRVVLGSLFGVILIGGIVAGGVYALGANDIGLLHKDWAGLQSCMLGAPLKAGELPAERVRALELASVGTDPTTRPKKGSDTWPASCAPQAAAVQAHGIGAEHGKELVAAATALATALAAQRSGSTDFSKAVTDTWAAAAASGLKDPPGEADATTPKPVDVAFPGFEASKRMLGAENLTTTTIFAQPATSGVVRFLVDDRSIPSGPVVCTAAEADSGLGCTRLGSDVTAQTGLRLLGASEPSVPPYVFAGDRGDSGVFGSDGKLAMKDVTTYGASFVDAKKARLLIRRGGAKSLWIVEQTTGGAAVDVAQMSGSQIDNLNDATLAFDSLVWLSGLKNTPPSHLMVQGLAAAAGAPVDVGEIPDASLNTGDKTARFTACRAGDTTALRVHAVKADYVTVLAQGKWGAPAAIPPAVRGGTLTCRNGEAMLVKVTHQEGSGPDHPMIDIARCKPGACELLGHVSLSEIVHGDPGALPLTKEASTAVAIDDKLLLVWASAQGGVRARMGAVAELATAKDTILSAEVDKQTGAPTALDVSAIPAARFAVVLVRTTSGIASLKVDTTGSFAPLPAAFK